MRLEYAFFARAVELTQEGLFSVIGGGIGAIKAFSIANPPPTGAGVLVASSSMALLIRLSCLPAECGHQHSAAIERIAPDGTIIRLGEFPLTPQLSNDYPNRPQSISLCVNFVNIDFPVGGEYRFRVSVDGQETGIAPLFVALTPEQVTVP